MSDLICRKTMMRCPTPGMCSPHGGCQSQHDRDSSELRRLCAERDQLYTAQPAPDAELVELVRSKFPRIDPCQPVPLDEKAHCCEYTIYVERERLHRIIDAKMASLEVKP